jgi:sterol desaturase/sphingolipid hydroxylase (fatty acid hydroxylase superfamily)
LNPLLFVFNLLQGFFNPQYFDYYFLVQYSHLRYFFWSYIFVLIPLFFILSYKKAFSIKALFQFCFPKQLYGTQETINLIIMALLVPILLWSVSLVLPSLTHSAVQKASILQTEGFLKNFLRSAILGKPSLLQTGMYFIVIFIIEDFMFYIIHYTEHKIPLLWHFHKVHEITTVLTPFARMCHHPLALIYSTIFHAFIAGILYGSFLYLFKVDSLTEPFFLFLILTFTLQGLLITLQHTQYWICFPTVLSHIFISPAQHQIHHSNAPEHFDKNFGRSLAIWDYLFGTLYIPKHYEALTFGLKHPEEKACYNHPLKMLFYPFVDCFKDPFNLTNRPYDSDMNVNCVPNFGTRDMQAIPTFTSWSTPPPSWHSADTHSSTEKI